MTDLDKVLGALGALLVAVYPLVKAWVATKLTPQRLAHVTDLASIAVRAAEKVGEAIPGTTSAAKYAVASNYLSDAAKRLGFKLSADELNGFIQASLRQMQAIEQTVATVNV